MYKLIFSSVLCLSFAFLSACTTKQAKHFVGGAIASGADTEVRYSPSQCRTLRAQCVQGDFQEWETSEKEMGCSCKKL
ncbi:hypothetical protein RS130_11545 [Paraglaciecola aquimarina]|uniref:Lipoprotein n=1 Tax=Paraglaciecola aquimarina TaxID=1235557 RepID=A0ABU3SWX1_9ALTE|nr:hypothetical protein [Paraglaciecola aquimarina]MDU0354483.1 hypothetical protein [Paraglaciecola aquimarina]